MKSHVLVMLSLLKTPWGSFQNSLRTVLIKKNKKNKKNFADYLIIALLFDQNWIYFASLMSLLP